MCLDQELNWRPFATPARAGPFSFSHTLQWLRAWALQTGSPCSLTKITLTLLKQLFPDFKTKYCNRLSVMSEIIDIKHLQQGVISALELTGQGKSLMGWGVACPMYCRTARCLAAPLAGSILPPPPPQDVTTKSACRHCQKYCTSGGKIRRMVLPALFFLKIALFGVLWFHTNFRTVCSISVKNATGIL